MCYYSFNNYLREKFGARVHRISLNAGFTCPNRDGSLSENGCIFCNDEGFSPVAKTRNPLKKQLEIGMDSAKKRFKAEKFIAYFQNATNTYADVDELKKAYDVIKEFPEIVGLFISTRPDCIDDKKLNLIESYADTYEVWIEYGLQTIHDRTLKKINRSHTFSDTLQSMKKTAARKIKIGIHVILGLPGESKADMIETAETIAKLPVSGVKLHVLHVLRNTELERQFSEGKIKLLTPSEYISLACDFLECLSPNCVVLRLVSDAKKEVLIAPEWINDKQKVTEGIKAEFKKRKTKQGISYGKKSLCVRQL